MAKSGQNYGNHRRLVPLYHYVTYGLIGLFFAAAVWVFIRGYHPMIGVFLLLNGTVLGLVGFFARAFALRAQDRAIRAEENFRHFILSGKPLSKNLRLGQIIALRFASDEEFIALAERAEKENLGSKEIKQAIKNWRGDYHRV